MLFSAVHCGKRGAPSILTHYATVMQAYVQRQMGNGVGAGAGGQQQSICQKLGPFVSPRQGSTRGKTSHRQSDPLIVVFSPSLKIFKSNTGTAFA